MEFNGYLACTKHYKGRGKSNTVFLSFVVCYSVLFQLWNSIFHFNCTVAFLSLNNGKRTKKRESEVEDNLALLFVNHDLTLLPSICSFNFDVAFLTSALATLLYLLHKYSVDAARHTMDTALPSPQGLYLMDARRTGRQSRRERSLDIWIRSTSWNSKGKDPLFCNSPITQAVEMASIGDRSYRDTYQKTEMCSRLKSET